MKLDIALFLVEIKNAQFLYNINNFFDESFILPNNMKNEHQGKAFNISGYLTINWGGWKQI